MNPQMTVIQGQQPKQGQSVDIVSGFGLGAYDNVAVTYPTTSQEVYVFTKAGKNVGTITIDYSDAVTKAIITNVRKS